MTNNRLIMSGLNSSLYLASSRILSALAIAGIFFMFMAAFITVGDILVRRVIGVSIYGLVDLTQLAMMHAVFMSIAYGFSCRAHVAVTILVDLFPPRLQVFLSVFWWLVGAGVMVVLAYATFLQALAIQEYGDVSQNIRIPMFLYWLPVVVGLALSVIGSFLAVFLETHAPAHLAAGE